MNNPRWRRMFTHAQALPEKQTTWLLLGLVLICYAILGAIYEMSMTEIPFSSSRPPLAYLINAFASHAAGRFGVYLAHVGMAFSVFLLAFRLLSWLRPGLPYRIVFTGLFLGHILWQQEVFELRDTTLLSLLLVAFLVITTSNLNFLVRFIGMGVIAGLAWLTRASGIVCVPMLFLMAGLAVEESWKRRSLALTLALISFIVVTAPWQARLYATHGTFSLSPFPGNGMYNMVKGNNHLSADIYPFADFDYIQDEIKEELADEHGDFHVSTVFAFMRSHPSQFLTLKAKEVAFYFLPLRVPFGKGGTTVTVEGDDAVVTTFLPSPLCRGPFLVFNLLPLLACCLYLVYLFKYKARLDNPRERRFLLALRLMTGLYLLLHLVIWVETRLILPLHPLWFAGAAVVGGDALYRRLECSSS